MGWGGDRELERGQKQEQEQDQEQKQEQDQLRRTGVSVPHVIPWIRAVAEDWSGGRRRENPKRMGELSQAAFLVKAQRLGFALAVPWGDSEKCDFVVWEREGGRLLRVQVKATGRLHRGGYDVQPVYGTRGEGKKTYTAAQIDVLAAHVVREWRGGCYGQAAGSSPLSLPLERVGMTGCKKGRGELGRDDVEKGDTGGGDFGAGEFQQDEVWYLLPVRAIAGVKSLRFFPGLKSRRPRWERYREAWEWMRGK